MKNHVLKSASDTWPTGAENLSCGLGRSDFLDTSDSSVG